MPVCVRVTVHLGVTVLSCDCLLSDYIYCVTRYLLSVAVFCLTVQLLGFSTDVGGVTYVK